LKQNRLRAGSFRAGALVALTTLVALCACTSALAGGGSYGNGGPTAEESKAGVVYMKADKQGLRFVAPKTIVSGENLKVINQSNPKQVGPHTFSLVTKSSLPKTPKARQICFTKNHICKAIATWHGVKGNGPVKTNPAEAGEEGWDTLGSVSKEGDSWFTGEKPGTSFSQAVTADTSAGPTRIYFICAIHPEMQGSINVLPGG
jgi:hypothetical protein